MQVRVCLVMEGGYWGHVQQWLWGRGVTTPGRLRHERPCGGGMAVCRAPSLTPWCEAAGPPPHLTHCSTLHCCSDAALNLWRCADSDAALSRYSLERKLHSPHWAGGRGWARWLLSQAVQESASHVSQDSVS